MTVKFFDNVRHIVSGTPGTGDITFGAAPAGWQSLSAAGAADGNVAPFYIEDASNAWEISYLTIGGGVTTGARRLVASSTGSLLSLTSAATLTCVPFARDLESGLTIGGIGFTLESTPDNGCVELDGATVRDGATDYPIVAARHPSMVSGDDLRMPDFRGLGLRGWDHGAGVDPDARRRTANWRGGPKGDEVGSEQADAFQGHWHELYGLDDDRANAGGGGDAWHGRKDSDASNQMQDSSNQPSVQDIKSDGTNGAPRTSSETRMKNVAVLFQMRLF